MNDKVIDEEIQSGGSSGYNTELLNNGVDANTFAQYGHMVAKPVYGFGDFITGRYAQKQQAYAQSILDKKYEAEQLASARAYENSEVQRRVADMKKAGLNPYWLTSLSSAQGVSDSSSRSNAKDSSHLSGSSANSVGRDVLSLLKTLAIFALMG